MPQKKSFGQKKFGFHARVQKCHFGNFSILLCVKKAYVKLSIVMKCPYKFDESENVHRVKCP